MMIAQTAHWRPGGPLLRALSHAIAHGQQFKVEAVANHSPQTSGLPDGDNDRRGAKDDEVRRGDNRYLGMNRLHPSPLVTARNLLDSNNDVAYGRYLMPVFYKPQPQR